MKTLLVDTNVILDVLLDRSPHSEASARIWGAVEAGAARGLLAAHAITTIHYLIRKELGTAKATRTIAAMMSVAGVAPVDGATIQTALKRPIGDFEDAVTAAAAQLSGCHYVVTRDPRGFRDSPVRALTPEAVLALL